MAFAYTTDKQGVIGDMKYAAGTFTNGVADTGGDIDTGLRYVIFAKLQHTGSAVVTNDPAINESFPRAPGTLTIVTDADADGIWFAVGK